MPKPEDQTMYLTVDYVANEKTANIDYHYYTDRYNDYNLNADLLQAAFENVKSRLKDYKNSCLTCFFGDDQYITRINFSLNEKNASGDIKQIINIDLPYLSANYILKKPLLEFEARVFKALGIEKDVTNKKCCAIM